MAINPFVAGEILDTVRLNQLVTDLNSAKSTAESADTTATNVRNALQNQVLCEEHTLWTGVAYFDGGTNYSLWSTNAHRAWDVVRIYVTYDPVAIGGTNGHAFEINCGPNYAYNQDSVAYSTLCTTYASHYRRICVLTYGLAVVNGEGAGWYLTKVVGVVKKKVT